jgi:hypothetical protein
MVRCRALWLLALICAEPLCAADERVYTEGQYSSDSDDQRQKILVAGYQRSFPSVHHESLTVALGHRELTAPIGRESFEFGRMKGGLDLWPGASLTAQLDQMFGRGWSPTLGSAAVHWKPADPWYFETSVERDLVDTVVAVRNRVVFDTAAVSADWSPVKELTLVAGVSRGTFSDDNNRSGRTLRLIYSPARLPWFNAQLRTKRSDSAGTGIGYFNPRRLEEYEFLLSAAGAPFGEHWNLSLQAGAGSQHVDRNAHSRIYTIDGRARGWFTQRYGLESRVACNNTGGLSAAPAEQGYRYCLGSLSLIVAW